MTEPLKTKSRGKSGPPSPPWLQARQLTLARACPPTPARAKAWQNPSPSRFGACLIWTQLQWWCWAGSVAKNTQKPGQLLCTASEAAGPGRAGWELGTPTCPGGPAPLPVRSFEDPSHSIQQGFLERFGKAKKKKMLKTGSCQRPCWNTEALRSWPGGVCGVDSCGLCHSKAS